MQNFPLFYQALFCIAILGALCAGLGSVAGSRPAFVTYVIGTGVIVSAALIIRDRRR